MGAYGLPPLSVDRLLFSVRIQLRSDGPKIQQIGIINDRPLCQHYFEDLPALTLGFGISGMAEFRTGSRAGIPFVNMVQTRRPQGNISRIRTDRRFLQGHMGLCADRSSRVRQRFHALSEVSDSRSRGQGRHGRSRSCHGLFR